jgi:hypothetical protein
MNLRAYDSLTLGTILRLILQLLTNYPVLEHPFGAQEMRTMPRPSNRRGEAQEQSYRLYGSCVSSLASRGVDDSLSK